MQSGLNKKLMTGVPKLNPDLSVTVLAEDGTIVHIIPANALIEGGIGCLYERVVGLHYEEIGYLVEYRCHLGFSDRGVDLVARRHNECRFIQCKFTLRPMSPARVESLLFSASSFVHENLGPIGNHFDLVVPVKRIAFPVERRRAEQAFLRYNSTQRTIQLNLVEVPLEIPDTVLGGTVVF